MASRDRLVRALGGLVPLVVWSVAMARGATGAQWRADLSVLRDRGLSGVGIGGAVSAAWTNAAGLLPLGSHASRAAAASAVAVAVASAAVYRLGRRLLAARLRDSSGGVSAGDDRLAALLAAVAALASALSSSWQAEATVGGGSAVALALVLLGLDAVAACTTGGASLTPGATARWLGVAACLGLAFAESPPAGFALFVAASGMVATADRRPPSRLAAPLLYVAVVAALFVATPVLWRPFAPASLNDGARAMSAVGRGTLPQGSSREAVLSWVEQLGVLQLALAGLGLARAAVRARERPFILMVVALPALDLLAPFDHWLDGSAMALRPLGISAVALASSLGVAEVVCFLRELEIPMARVASVLAVVGHMTLAAVLAEESGLTANRADRLAAEEWTDRALGALPRDAAVVVRSADRAWRLWAAQRVEGQRPDVLLVAAPLLRRHANHAALAPAGAGVAPILRDLALAGSASEFALSALADERPLRVELDESWGPRVLAHVVVDGPWLRFDPEPEGASDRPDDGASALAAEERVAALVRGGLRRDVVSAEVLGRTLKEHAAALALVGLSPAATPLIDEVGRLLPNDPFSVAARLRVEHAARRGSRSPVELRDLLRF